MTNKNLIEAFEIIGQSGEGWFKGEISEMLVLKAEEYLQVRFPFWMLYG